MQPTAEISREHFQVLTERGTRQIDNDIDRGQLVFWCQPAPEARATGKRFRRTFIAVDAVLAVLSDIFVERGLRREAISLALPAMQVVIAAGVDRLQIQMMIAISRDNRLSVGCGTLEELRSMDLFVGKTQAVSWRLALTPAVERVRERAKKHRIALPDKFAPSEAPLWMRGKTPAWKFSTGDGRITSQWKPNHQIVQMAEVIQMAARQ